MRLLMSHGVRDMFRQLDRPVALDYIGAIG